MVPILFVLPLYVLITRGRRLFIIYLIWMFLSAIFLTALFFRIFGTEDLLFNSMLFLKNHINWKLILSGFKMFFLDCGNCFFWLITCFTAQHLLCTKKPVTLRALITESRWSLFFLVGIFMTPLAILGVIKAGGDINLLSPAAYFFAIASSTAVAEFLCKLERHNERVLSGFVRLLLTVYLMVGIGVNATPFFYSQKYYHDELYTKAYKYLLKHKGEVYFPGNPLLHIMAENRAYHFSCGLYDRELNGYPIDKARFLRYIPKDLAEIAVNQQEQGELGRYVLKYLPEFSRKIIKDDLPGWDIYVKN